MESWKFECAVCETVGTATALPSGKIKVKHIHAPGCKVAKMEKGDMCPACGGTDIAGSGDSFCCLNDECGHQWEPADLGVREDEYYTNLGDL